MLNIILENLISIAAAAMIALIGILGSLVTRELNKNTALSSINLAQQELVQMAQQTVGELQQTIVEKLKEAHEDKKLTGEEIAALGETLVIKTMEKMSAPAKELLNAAGVDIIALIHGTGEDWINSLKK